MNDRLYRSTTDRVLTGVAGGLAAYLGVDPSIVRVGWVVLTILTGGIAALVYLVMAVVVPEAPVGWTGRGPATGPAPWTSSTGPWAPPAGGAETPEMGPPPAGEQAPGAVPGWRGTDAPTWGDPSATPVRATGSSSGSAGIVFGLILIGLGAWFLVRQYVDIDWDLVWPVVVIGLGAVIIAAAMRRRD